jgi:hypothetical protein
LILKKKSIKEEGSAQGPYHVPPDFQNLGSAPVSGRKPHIDTPETAPAIRCNASILNGVAHHHPIEIETLQDRVENVAALHGGLP